MRVAYDLLVCDLDGTLIDQSLTLDPALVEAFRRAVSRGLLISIATGRMPPGVDRYRDELGLTAPLIFYNGALVRDPGSGRDLLSLTLPPGLLRGAYDIFANAPVHPLFYRDDALYCLEPTGPIREYAADQGVRVHAIPDPLDFLVLGAFVKSLFIGHPDALPLVREDLQQMAGARARLVMTRRDYLEMIPAEASKGTALRHLAAHLGIPLERVIAVGDQENDLEMIRAAGLGVAMPQAPDFVRQAAARVAPPPRAGGLVALLREVLPERFA
jgi:Cof subfamily protein (haloacid dehalogenase superfamily)